MMASRSMEWCCWMFYWLKITQVFYINKRRLTFALFQMSSFGLFPWDRVQKQANCKTGLSPNPYLSPLEMSFSFPVPY